MDRIISLTALRAMLLRFAATQALDDFLDKRERHVVSHVIMKGEHLGEFEEFTLLAVRALGDNTYAVPIQQYMEKVTARAVSIGSTYAALTRLEQKGFLRSSMSQAVAQRGGKSKRIYAVTPSGLQAARDLHRVRERMWKAIAEGGRS
jgi:PadR family transcriptional regulator PadR